MKTKYFYKNSEGKLKRYRGKVEEKDGKLFGTLISNSTKEYRTELTKEFAGTVEYDSTTYLVWKDRDGIEHILSEEDNVVDNKVVIRYEDKIDIKYTPAVDEQIYFTLNGQKFDGEIIEENGKYFGKV